MLLVTSKCIGQLLNPLAIDHILENIFRHLEDEQDLKQCRLVSLKWNECASLRLQVISQIIQIGGQNPINISSFLRICEKSHTKKVPFGNFDLLPDTFCQEDKFILQKLFRTCSLSMHTLRIWFDISSNLECTETFAKYFFLPRLRSLVFEDVRRSAECRKNHNVYKRHVLYQSLYLNCPNLEKLAFHFPNADTENIEKGQVVENFVDLICQHPKRRLRELEFEMKMTDGQLQQLSFAQFSLLKVLSVNLRESTISTKSLNNFLKSVKDTLVKLKITDFYGQAKYTVEFPRMDKLVQLELFAWENSANRVKFKKFNYSQVLPKLEELSLVGWSDHQDLIYTFFQYNKLLQVLHLPYTFSQPLYIPMLNDLFPSLQKLQLTFAPSSQEVLIKVFEFMNNLKELEITFSVWMPKTNLNSILTGINQDECDLLEEESNFEFELAKSNYSLANMKGIEKLMIQDHSLDAVLTDVTVNYSFLQMSNLRQLTIPPFQISEACQDRLRKRLKLILL